MTFATASSSKAGPQMQSETYVATVVCQNLTFTFFYKGKRWSLLGADDINLIYMDILRRMPMHSYERSTKSLDSKAGQCVRANNFNVAAGEGMTMSGLTKLYYEHTKVRKGAAVRSFFVPDVSSGTTVEPMLYLVELPSDEEYRGVLSRF
jgi:hypothetical protein